MSDRLHSAFPSHHDPRGGFRNPWPSSELHGLREFLKWRATYQRRPDTAVRGSLPRVTPAFATPSADPGRLSCTWVGHSTFLIQLDGANVLTDPMWGERCSPVQFAGPRRRMPPGIPFEILPHIDLIVQSHDHYDHLDRGTVRRLAEHHPDARWVVPLRLGDWLSAQRVRRITELDWWQSTEHGPITVTATPAQHFSGRTFHRNRTLWCGWTMSGTRYTLYFVGDTGYFSDVHMVGSRLGPFDAVLVPIGAYDPRWFMRAVHLDPEEAVRLYRDVTNHHEGHPSTFTAMHWGTFKLTEEPLREPPERLQHAWDTARLPPELLWIPKHGETRWWEGDGR